MLRRRLVEIFCLGSTVCLLGADWPQWRGPNRDGTASTSPPLVTSLPAEGLKPAWLSESLPGGFSGGWGSPIVADGKVYLFVHHRAQKTPGELPKKKFPYLADDKRGRLSAEEYVEYEKNRRAEDLEFGKYYEFKETLVCLDAETGKSIWRTDTPSVYSRFVQSGTLAYADGKLYFLGSARHARCVDAATGKEVWNTVLPGDFTDEFYMSSFLVSDGVATAFAGKLFGLDAATGKLLWEGNEKMTSQHSSVVGRRSGERTLGIANVGGGNTVCFDVRTGKEVWRVNSGANNSTPVIVGDRMITYGSNRSNGLRCYKLTADKAEELWKFQRVGDKGSSPVVVGKSVYVQGEKRLACVDLESGDEQWSAELDLASPQYTSLVAADDKVIYAYDGLLCFAADPTEYRPLAEVKFNKAGLMATEAAQRKLLKLDEVEKKPNGLEESTKIYQREVGNQGPLKCASPAIVDGRLYLRLNGNLACYDLRAGKTPASAAPTTTSGE